MCASRVYRFAVGELYHAAAGGRSPMKRVLCLIVVAGVALSAGVVWGQGVTTGAINGQVTDPNGDPLPGATVTATLAATGTRYAVITDGDGRFAIPNARVGTSYRVEAQLSGFQTRVKEDVAVRLGEATALSFQLSLEAVSGELVVVGESNPLINPTRTGAGSSLSQEVVEITPKIDRSLADLARTNPLFNATAENDGSTILTVAGRNNRYNNIQIDGAVNNDLFGLAATGVPGGQSDTQPISIDAIGEVQLVVAPYDVRQGGFTGGGINAITRSGTNSFKGSVYGFYFDDSLVGSGPDDFPELGTFEEKQYGFRLGGPIMQDKAFFFVNGEISRKNVPTGYSIDGSGGEQFANGTAVDDAIQLRDFLISNYGYDPGGLGQVTRPTDSDKYFGRFDFNLSNSHSLTLRHNYVDASNVLNFPSSYSYEWPNAGYDFQNQTNSTVAQLNSVFGAEMFNELRVTYQTIKDRRKYLGDAFPSIYIADLSNSGDSFDLGSEAYSTANSLDQDIIEITDDFTFFAGDHEIVLGTHNELFSFKNLFIQQNFGAYSFDTIDDFYAGNAYRYDYTYSNDSNPYDEFDVHQLGFYIGDTWRVKSNFTLIGGLRVDIPLFPDKPQNNPLVEEIYGYKTSDVPSGNQMFSPRVGFNWDIKGDGTSQLRGGAGLFSGRTPFVWISNNYGRNGIEQTTLRAVDYVNGIPFNPDPFGQPSNIGGASTQEVNIVDPNYEFPQVWRYDLGYDQELPWWGLIGTVEALYTQSENEIDYKNLNIEQTGGTAFDGRPLYQTVSNTFTGAYFLTNTDKGDTTNVTVKVEKPYAEGLYGFVAYTYGEANVVNEGTSSRAVSNWNYQEAVDPNNAGLSTSDFEVKHRFTVSMAYEFNRDTRWGTTVSAYYNRQSGRPYSLIFASDFPSINGDTATGNDLFYVPTGADDVEITNGTWEQLDAFLHATGYDEYAGKIAPRNAKTGPWTGSLDLHIAQQIPMPYGELEVTADVFNLMNLFNSDYGHVEFVNFGTITPAKYLGTNDDGKPIYQLYSAVTGLQDNGLYSTDNLRSRWRAKLGLRYSF